MKKCCENCSNFDKLPKESPCNACTISTTNPPTMWQDGTSKLKCVLDLSEFVTDSKGNKLTNELFFRYHIVNDQDEVLAKVWFAQMMDTGNVYSVSILLSKELDENFSVYIESDSDDYYPQRFQLCPYSARLYTHNFTRYKENLETAFEIGNEVMNLFNSGIHYEKYMECNKK